MEIDRRRFVLGIASAGVVATAISSGWDFFKTSDSPKLKRFLRFGQYHRDPSFSISAFYSANALTEKRVLQLDLETHTWESFEVSSAPHVVETHPSDFRYSLSATQKSDTISAIDWNNLGQIYEHTLSAGHFFYGHGVFSVEGNSVFASTYNAKKPASIMRFSFPELKPEASFDLPYGLSHEVRALDSNHLLLGMSGIDDFRKPGFGILDMRSSKFILFPIPDARRPLVSAVTHLEALSSGFVGTFNEIKTDIDRPSGLASLVGDKVEFHLRPENSGIPYEILSLAYESRSSQIWATIPAADKILICEESNQRVTGEITADQLKSESHLRSATASDFRPLGICHDSNRGQTYIVTADNVIVLETKSRTVQKVISKPHAGYSAHARLA